MTRFAPRLRLLRLLAALCVVLMLAVTVASAWLRLTQPQSACSDWPICRQSVQVVAATAVAPGWLAAPETLAAVRRVHRTSGSGVLLAAALLVLLGWRGRAGWRHAIQLAATLVVLALALAVLGIAAGRSPALAVRLGNMLGGFVMLAVAWRLTQALRSPPAHALPALGAWPAWTALAWLLQAALGLVSGTGRGTLYPLLHLMLGLAVVSLSWAFAFVLKQRGRGGFGLALFGLSLWQLAMGVTGAMNHASPGIILLHNTGAAIGLALLAGLVEPRPATGSAPASAA